MSPAVSLSDEESFRSAPAPAPGDANARSEAEPAHSTTIHVNPRVYPIRKHLSGLTEYGGTVLHATVVISRPAGVSSSAKCTPAELHGEAVTATLPDRRYRPGNRRHPGEPPEPSQDIGPALPQRRSERRRHDFFIVCWFGVMRSTSGHRGAFTMCSLRGMTHTHMQRLHRCGSPRRGAWRQLYGQFVIVSDERPGTPTHSHSYTHSYTHRLEHNSVHLRLEKSIKLPFRSLPK